MKQDRIRLGGIPGHVQEIYVRQGRPMRIYIAALCILGVLAVVAAFAIIVDAGLL